MNSEEFKKEYAIQYSNYLTMANDEPNSLRGAAFTWAFREAYYLGVKTARKELEGPDKAHRLDIATTIMQEILRNDNEINHAIQDAVWDSSEVPTVPKAIARYSFAIADALLSESEKAAKNGKG